MGRVAVCGSCVGVVAVEGDERHLREQPMGILGLYTYSLFAICLFDFCNRDGRRRV
jgi:hypothetical protein